MREIEDKLIVALDVDTLDKARHFVKVLYPTVKLFKIGSQLFTAYGPEAVKAIGEKGAKIFLDLKFHDIPQTVFSGVVSGTGLSCKPEFIPREFSDTEQEVKPATLYPVFMMTVHAAAGIEVLRSAMKGAVEKAEKLNIVRPFIVGVTVLTSENLGADTLRVVLERARHAKEAGLDGIVCSVHETTDVRQELGNNFIIVNPGIRPRGADVQDQKRVATAAEALKAGANFIVAGRPILEAADPLAAVKNLFG